MSDHSLVSLVLKLSKLERGKGYFKLINSLIHPPEYHDKIRNTIKESAEINKTANPNTLWEIIKGAIRNETIKYASYKKKEQNKHELRLTEDINNIKHNLTKGGEQENELKRLKEKNQELKHLYESQIQGFVIRSKASYIEGGEKNTKHFASLEKKRSDAKTLHKLVINGTEYTSEHEILEKKNNVILRNHVY